MVVCIGFSGFITGSSSILKLVFCADQTLVAGLLTRLAQNK